MKNITIDFRNTAGWKLMQHEENLKKLIKQGRRDNNVRKTGYNSEYKG